MQDDFRFLLRERVRTDHDRVDGAISSCALDRRDGFVRFLAIHHRCFDAMLGVAAANGRAAQTLARMVERIGADLTRLGAAETIRPGPRLPVLDEIALDYVIEGSRLGTAVLRRQWAAATDPAIVRADAYFSMVPERGRWREVCDALSTIPADSPRAMAITADVRVLFRLFHDVAQETLADPVRVEELT